MASSAPLLIAILILITSGIKVAEPARVFTFINDCEQMIWPAITPGPNFGGGGFALKSKQSMAFTAPVDWSGRIWGRTGCKFDSSGNGTCQTGSCGISLKCGPSGSPPTSLAEFTLGALDFYDVSLVDGFNLPIVVTPVDGTGNCSEAGCDADLRTSCPSELAAKEGGQTVGCKSACNVFQTDEYCCKGLYGNSATCKPTNYSKEFKAACPAAYSYAYDDQSSLHTCAGANYIITFCSARNHTVCTYHENKLVCSGSSGFQSLWHKWLTMLIYTIILLGI